VKKIIFDGAYGINSFGDDAPMVVLVNLIREKIGEVEMVVVSRHPDEDHYAEFSIRSVKGIEYESKSQSEGKWFHGFNPEDDKEDLNSLYNEIKSSDLLVLGAGNFLNDYTLDILRGPIPRFLVMSMMARMAETPVMWFGLSAGPLSSEMGLGMVKIAAEFTSILTVRDKDTKKLLEAIGIEKKINLMPDAVYGIKMPGKGHAGKFKGWVQAHSKGIPVIAMSTRSMPQGLCIDTEQYQSVLSETCTYITDELGYSVLLIPQCEYVHGGYDEDDRNIARGIIKVTGKNDKIFTIEDELNFVDCVALYEGAVLSIATRLHGNVFSAMQKIPTIGINYNPKVLAFHKWLGTEDFVIDVTQLSSNALVGKIRYALDNVESFKNKSNRIDMYGAKEVGGYADLAISVI